MELLYSQIVTDTDGTPIIPNLRLKTLAGETLGTLNGVHDLKFNINYSELSEISFTIPYMNNGLVNSLYSQVVGYKVVWTKHYGVYLLTTPQTTGTGLEETKTVKGYSLEKSLERKKFFLAEGTYSLEDICGKIEADTGWKCSGFDAELAGRYRTFAQYDSNVLSFMYGDMMTKYHCVVVFDTYGKKFKIVDAAKSITTLPIYLSYDNLVSQTDVTELSDELITKLHVYGADNLSIVGVNPIADDYIINLDHFIQNGDISGTVDVQDGDQVTTVDLAETVQQWQLAIAAQQQNYTGLTALRSSATAKKIMLEAELVDLNGELDNLTIQQSTTLQAIQNEKTDDGKATQEQNLKKIYGDIEEIKGRIKAKQDEIDTQEKQVDDYANSIKAIVDTLKYENYFAEEVRAVLDQFLIEDTVTESTFVASDIDTKVSGKMSTVKGTIKIETSDIARVDITEFKKTMYVIASGKLTLTDADAKNSIVANINRGTIEVSSDNKYLCSFFLGSCAYQDTTHPSATLTLDGIKTTDIDSDISQIPGELEVYEGTTMSFSVDTSDMFLSANVTEYQRYSVSQELYEYGREILAEKAVPTYEFTVDAANFLFQNEFLPFKERLEFGNGIYLMLGSMGRVVATFIGMELDFGDSSSIGLNFANRFQKHDGKTYLKQLLEKTYNSSRSFDAGKYIYNQAANMTTQVTEFMNSAFDAATNKIIGASNQSVVIDGAGIHVTSEENPKTQIRIVNDMIAMTDDGWQTSKVAIGNFPYTNGEKDSSGNLIYHDNGGVNAEIIAGKLIIGNNLIIENVNDDGVMQFKVDSSGAWMNNSTFVIQNNSGSILLHPSYGIAAGNKDLFTLNGTTVTPSFIKNGSVVTDNATGMPQNASFYLGLDGSAYFGGTLNSSDGKIGGFTLDDGRIYTSGTYGTNKASYYVELNANSDSNYAFWVGNSDALNAKFSIQKDGTVKVKGSLDATSLMVNGNSVLTGDKISGSSINAKGITVYSDSGIKTFEVKSNGTVYVAGDITANSLAAGSTIESPIINGGIFYATGQGIWHGDDDNDYAAYYICDSYASNIKGYLCYDTNGNLEKISGDVTNAKNRVILATQNEVALKLRSDGDLSIEAAHEIIDPLSGISSGYRKNTIYMQSPTKLADIITLSYGINYGTEADMPNAYYAEPGQLFFVLQ